MKAKTEGVLDVEIDEDEGSLMFSLQVFQNHFANEFSSPEELGKRILKTVNPTFRIHETKIIAVERSNVDMMWDDDIGNSQRCQ